MWNRLRPLFSWRFLKFCAVGTTGVGVNLALLALFADALGLQVNLASGLAIEASINTNFLINELWTFRDRRENGAGLSQRWIQFHLVSLAGAAVQWTVFIAANIAWLLLAGGGDALAAYFCDTGAGFIGTYLVRPVAEPPDVGALKYVSQLGGIGVATFWNYYANFHWTWGRRKGEADHG